MRTLDQMILEIRTAFASSSFVNWGSLKQDILAHPDKELLNTYFASHKKNPDLEPGDRHVISLSEVEFPMRWIPAGTFWMGAGEDDKDAFSNEKPQHAVTLTRGFWMMETPVTQGQYLDVMGENPSRFTEVGLDAPVERVSWYDAAVFANKLSALEGLSACFVGSGEQMEGVGNKGSDYVGCEGWRLPTEAEWEYACRAGTVTPRYGELDKIAWYDENSNHTTNRVGQKQANAWGLHDTLGNVWEWCYDWFGGYSAQAATDLVGAATGTGRVKRGGGWYYYANNVRAAQRSSNTPTYRDYIIGFRLVRSSFENLG